MIVLDDADVDGAVSAASVGRFFNCGQACLAVKRLYLHEAIADEFVEKLAAKVGRLKVGAGTAEGTTIGPLHWEAQRDDARGAGRLDARARRRAAAGESAPTATSTRTAGSTSPR